MKRNKGFTLVELLVVIAIIGLLAGILLPAVSKVQAQARIRVTQSNLREIKLAMDMYNSLYGVYPPASDGGLTKLARLVSCKKSGLSPKQLVSPASGKVAPAGTQYIANYDNETAAGGPPGSGLQWTTSIDYGSRKKDFMIPVSAVNPAGTALAAETDAARQGHGDVISILFLDGHCDQTVDSDTWNNNTNEKSLKLDVLDADTTIGN